MIIKELDQMPVLTDPMSKAGRAAEEQMAFYLRRAFADDATIRVLNGLRVVHSGEVAQVDHLVLHPYGLVAIESKSVTTTVRVNAHGEWTRWYNGGQCGMPSPLLQVQRQLDLLDRLLRAHPDLPYHDLFRYVVVAISDRGVIQRPRNLDLDEVCKADQVSGHIRDQIALYGLTYDKDGLGFLAWLPRAWRASTRLDGVDLDRLAAFLVAQHRPHHSQHPREHPPRTAPTAASRPTPAPSTSDQGQMLHRCRYCAGDRLTVAYGHSYYFKCVGCGGNTPIDARCATCGGRERVRKSGDDFFLDCARCKTSVAFHMNALVDTPRTPPKMAHRAASNL